jgi:hypothetical protein
MADLPVLEYLGVELGKRARPPLQFGNIKSVCVSVSDTAVGSCHEAGRRTQRGHEPRGGVYETLTQNCNSRG